MPEMPDRAFITGVDRLGFKIVGALGRIFGSLAAKDEESYFYQIQSGAGNGFVDLPAAVGGIATATIEITQDADFVANRLTHENVNPATGALLAGGSWTLNVRDGSSDRNMMNFQGHVNALVGTAQRSTPWIKNRLFRRNSTLVFDFTNLIATATRVFVSLWGYKIYDEASLDLTRRR